MISRQLKFSEAVLEATDQCMAKDPNVIVLGLGATDPKGIFGTTLGLEKKYGSKRIMDMPTSENGMTGVAIGACLMGKRPILAHQRVDFAFLSLDQIINNAAKWHYMFGGQHAIPLVIRLAIGRGWGQGPQHSQSLHSLLAHIPGLKVVLPMSPYDAKGLLIAAIEDNNPVIFLEHRWLHGVFGEVPEEVYRVPLGKAKKVRDGEGVTIVSWSHMLLESLHAAAVLSGEGIEAEVIDLRTLKPFDGATVLESVKKTGRLLVCDDDWRTVGFAAEVIAFVCEEVHACLKGPPKRISYPDIPVPSTPALANLFYPRTADIVNTVFEMLGRGRKTERELGLFSKTPLDIPNESFMGPF